MNVADLTRARRSYRTLFSMDHEIIECSDQVIRRRLAFVDPTVLRNKHTNGEKVSGIEYNGKQLEQELHDCYNDDRGYFSFYDQYRHRHIFVTSKEIGRTKSFHNQYDVQSLWDVIKPCSNHEHSSNMTPHRRKWFVTNMLHVCLQMFDTEGNILIFCNTGRSRSPIRCYRPKSCR